MTPEGSPDPLLRGKVVEPAVAVVIGAPFLLPQSLPQCGGRSSR